MSSSHNGVCALKEKKFLFKSRQLKAISLIFYTPHVQIMLKYNNLLIALLQHETIFNKTNEKIKKFWLDQKLKKL